MCTKIRLIQISCILILIYSTTLYSVDINPFDLTTFDENLKEKHQEKYTLYPINHTQTKKLEDVINQINPDHPLIFDHSKNQILIPESIKEDYTETIKKLDSRPQQISLEIKILEVNYSNLKQYQSIFSKLGEGIYTSYDTKKNKIIPTTKIETTLINLEKQGKAKILAKPKIITKSNHTAILNIGEKHPYIGIKHYNEQTRTTVKYIESGVNLNFEPKVINNEYIDLKIKADITHIKILKEVNSNQLPVLSSRHIETHIIIKDTHTLALAGMFEEKSNQNKGGIPILKNIPLIGTLFKYKSTRKERSDIMIFITPKIL